MKSLVRDIMDGKAMHERDVQKPAMSNVWILIGIAIASPVEAMRLKYTHYDLTSGSVPLVPAD